MEKNDEFVCAPRVLVLGASGAIGVPLVKALQRAGYRVRAGARDPHRLRHRLGPEIDTVALDLERPETLQSPLTEVSLVYYLVHSMSAEGDFGTQDLRAATALRQAATDAGVERILYLGAACAETTRSVHLRSRRATGAELANGLVPVVELRAPPIIGPGSVPFEAMHDLVRHLPLLPLPWCAHRGNAPLALENLLFYLVAAADPQRLPPGIYTLAGPKFLSHQRQFKCYARTLGRRLWSPRLPFLGPTLAGKLVPLLTPAPAAVIKALLGAMAEDIPADDALIRRFLPQRLLSFEDGIRRSRELAARDEGALEWYPGNPVFGAGYRGAAYYGHRLLVSRPMTASPAAVWAQLRRLGGENRYFALNWIWALREWIDWLAGGPGRSLGRDRPNFLVVGERLDSWRILDVQREKRLLLRFGMKGPGGGCLEFRLQPLKEGGCRCEICAYWHPAGLWGQLYWLLMKWPHRLVFRRLLWALALKAEAFDRSMGP